MPNLRIYLTVILLSLFAVASPSGDGLSDQLEAVRRILPDLVNSTKGEAGRIAVIGGSDEYAGAPYFSAISALRAGADIVHVFTTKAAAPVIKSYSPDLIVHPVLDSLDNHDHLSGVNSRLKNMDVVVVGPGLGRDKLILDIVEKIIIYLKSIAKPLIVDADGLYLVALKTDLVSDYPYPGMILTPNRREETKLKNAYGIDAVTNEIDFNKLGNHVTILKKGEPDKIFSSDKSLVWDVYGGGSPRRVGGQGDILSGTLATFFHWSLKRNVHNATTYPAYVASYGASTLTRLCNMQAFKKKGRNMISSDMLNEINPAFQLLFGLSKQ